MNEILQEIGLIGIVPVVIIENSDDAEPLARALLEGGLPCAEVTFRTQTARQSLEIISKTFPNLILGAGTILNIEQVKSAVDAGAKFIVSPGINPKVVEYCLANSIPITPGVVTPSDVEVAIGFGLDVVKFFPAEASGGVEFLKAMSAPYKDVKYIPTGGINEKNLLSYLKTNQVLACGGSWMVKSDLINQKKFDEIRKLTLAAVNITLGFDLRHIGINSTGIAEAQNIALQLQNVFGFHMQDGDGSIFIGTQFEIMKRAYLGTHGHIAISTNSIERAVAHLSRKGINIKPETRNEKNGKLLTVYLDVEFGGYAVHLVQI